MFGWLWGRRSAPPQREPLWKRVERCEESLARLERVEKDRVDKDKTLKEEAKTQEMFQRAKQEAKSEVLKEVADKFGQIDPWAAATLSRLPKRPRCHSGDDDDASVEPIPKKGRVVKAEDLHDILKELGFRRNLPKGRFTVRSLAEQLVVRRDFNKKSWTKMATNVLDEEIPQDTTDLAVGVLTAVQN